jgi:spermidine synthase
MRHILLDRHEGRLRLYLCGDLQFDAADERLYHEPLGLVPTALAAARAPRRPLRALILGGGDGLALREVLRSPRVAEVHLVDRDPAVLRLGREALAELNGGAFRDPRVRVHTADAARFLAKARGFDALLVDLTYPRDRAGARCFSLAAFGRMRAALSPGGVLGLNAVSPEFTPRAFACVGETLAASGLFALPYAFSLPSFQAEGYGRWGFYFASARRIRDEEMAALRFPAGTDLTPDGLLAGTRLPGTEADWTARPHRRSELLQYLATATPLPWSEPRRPIRFLPGARRARVAIEPPMLAARGFRRWLRGPDGGRSLEELVRSLPIQERGPIREAVMEWAQHVDTLLREVDLAAFLDQVLAQARRLPAAWAAELRTLRERIRAGLLSADDLVHQAYRVLAVLLLVLVLTNVFFPDNLYAKGYSSGVHSSGGSSSSGGGGGFHGFSFSGPSTRFVPFRSRTTTWGHAYGPRSASPVYDAQGQEYPAQRFEFSDARGGRQPLAALLALTKELQLLDSGGIAYVAPIPNHRFLVEPGRLRVLDTDGHEALVLSPAGPLEADVRRQLSAQGGVIEKALVEHRRWMEWVRWASIIPGGMQAVSELAQLEAMRQAILDARVAWEGASPAAEAAPGPSWNAIFPGVYLDPPRWPPSGRQVALVRADGSVRTRSLMPGVALTAEDRFLFWVLNRRFTTGGDASLREPIQEWTNRHGEALGLRQAAAGRAGGSS